MTTSPVPPRPPAAGVRASLTLLVIACIAPVAAVTAFLIFNFYRIERAQLIDNAVGHARAIITTIDHDIEGTQLALQTLGSSNLLQDQDLAGFHRRVSGLVGPLHADSVVLLDTDGTLLLSTRRPYGAPLARLGRAPLLQRIMANGRPGVSDIFTGPLNGKPIFSVGVPVLRDGAIVMTLNAIFTPQHLLHVLTEQKLPPDWRVSVLDTEGKVATRSHQLDKYAGQQVSADLRQQLASASESCLPSHTLDGQPVTLVYSRSPRTGWTAVLGIPSHELTARLHRMLAWLVAVALAALGAGLALAWLLAKRIARLAAIQQQPADKPLQGERQRL